MRNTDELGNTMLLLAPRGIEAFGGSLSSLAVAKVPSWLYLICLCTLEFKKGE